MDKEEEKKSTRKNKKMIMRDYMKEMEKAEKYKIEEDIKEEIIKNINILDEPDINDNKINEKLSEFYDNEDQSDNSKVEKKYLDELELYENIIKDKDLKDKLEIVKIKRIKGNNDEYSDYEYEIEGRHLRRPN